MTLGIDAHKYNHTVVAVDWLGTKLGERTGGTTSKHNLELLQGAAKFGRDRRWAVADCRQLSRRLEHELLGAGEAMVRVPPKLMAHARDGARTFGKSDPIAALAVARAALREPDLPTARLGGDARAVRMLVDHREDLVSQRTRIINRIRWHLHELDPEFRVPLRCLDLPRSLQAIAQLLAKHQGLVARLATELADRCAELPCRIDALEREIASLVTELAPSLLAIQGCGPLSAAKLLGETAGVSRFRSPDAFARHNGTAPLLVWSSNRVRHRLSRTGNRQINAAIHCIAVTQAHWSPEARAYLERRRQSCDTKMESLRVLKRRPSEVLFRAILAGAVFPRACPVAA